MNFREWMSLDEDVRQQKQGFVQLFRSVFGAEAQITEQPNMVKAIAAAAGRNIVAYWIPGTNHKAVGDENTETESFVKLDFFHLANQGTEDEPDYVGKINTGGNIAPQTMSFVRALMPLVKGLKQLDIHIWFDAVGQDRADSYAQIMQKYGFTLGWNLGTRQLWLAHPVEGKTVANNPYANMAGAALKSQRRTA